MRRSFSMFAAGLLGVGAALALTGPAAASGADTVTTNTCGTVAVTDQNHRGFYFSNATFDLEGLDVQGGNTTQGYFGHAVNNVPLSGDQSRYSIVTDAGTDVYKTGFAYYLGVDPHDSTTTIDNLFYEPQSYGQGIWHDGNYQFTGTLAQFLALYPNTTVSEFDGNYGPGVPDGTEEVQSIKFGCTTYTFHKVNRPPYAEFSVNNGGDSNYRTYGFDARRSFDPEHQGLTYTWRFGDGSPEGHGVTIRHTFPAANGKTYNVTLVVSDGNSTGTAFQKVTVHQ
jgi:hypothetical protein